VESSEVARRHLAARNALTRSHIVARSPQQEYCSEKVKYCAMREEEGRLLISERNWVITARGAWSRGHVDDQDEAPLTTGHRVVNSGNDLHQFLVDKAA
jgi:hypothetical protein